MFCLCGPPPHISASAWTILNSHLHHYYYYFIPQCSQILRNVYQEVSQGVGHCGDVSAWYWSSLSRTHSESSQDSVLWSADYSQTEFSDWPQTTSINSNLLETHKSTWVPATTVITQGRGPFKRLPADTEKKNKLAKEGDAKKVCKLSHRALGWASKVQLKSEMNENMIKEVKTMIGTPTETVCLSYCFRIFKELRIKLKNM